jgi:hypothetical protein
MPALLEYVRDEALPDREEILARLASHDRDVVLRILTLLCPCRNACYDVEIWERMLAIGSSQWDSGVREAANHALGTVRDRCPVDTRSRELMDALARRTTLGRLVAPQWLRSQLARGATWQSAVYPKVAMQDVPTLIESLSSEDERAIGDAIAALCPKNGRTPAKRVWRAILDAQRSPDRTLRMKAARASAALDVHQMSCAVRHE